MLPVGDWCTWTTGTAPPCVMLHYTDGTSKRTHTNTTDEEATNRETMKDATSQDEPYASPLDAAHSMFSGRFFRLSISWGWPRQTKYL